MKHAILAFAMDPLTGKIDMDLITTGRSHAFRQMVSDCKLRLLEALNTAAAKSIPIINFINSQKHIKDQVLYIFAASRVFSSLSLEPHCLSWAKTGKSRRRDVERMY